MVEQNEDWTGQCCLCRFVPGSSDVLTITSHHVAERLLGDLVPSVLPVYIRLYSDKDERLVCDAAWTRLCSFHSGTHLITARPAGRSPRCELTCPPRAAGREFTESQVNWMDDVSPVTHKDESFILIQLYTRRLGIVRPSLLRSFPLLLAVSAIY